jgi:PAS domain S-box-containing protein
VAQTGRALNVPDTRIDDRHFKGVDEETGLPILSILSVPLRVKGDVIGVIQVVDQGVGRFDETDARLVEALSSAASAAIENAQLYEELKSSQEYARNIISSSLDMIITVDTHRRIVEFNRAAQNTFGYHPDEVVGQHVDLLYADPQDSLAIHEAATSQGQCIRETYNRRKNGQVFPSLISASILHDSRGEVIGIMGVSRDITRQKDVEAEREQLILELQEAVAKIKTLRGLVPICSSCKKIRDDQGFWQQLEVYIQEHSDAEFSHGLCPDCAKKLYPGIFEDE